MSEPNPVQRDAARLFVLVLVFALVLAAVPPFLPDPDVLVPSWSSDQVLRYDPDTGAFIDAIVGAGAGTLSGSHSMAIGPDGHIYVPSFNNDKVLRFHGGHGAFLGDFVTAGLGGLDGPTDVKFGTDGLAYVCSFLDGAVYRYDGLTGAFVDTFIPSGLVPSFHSEWLEFMPGGDVLVSGGSTLNAIARFDRASGALVGAFVSPGAGGLIDPHGFTYGPDGHLYVASFGGNQVLRYDGATGAFLNVFVAAGSGGLLNPHGVAFGPAGRLYVTSWSTNEVLRYDGATGAFIDVFIAAGAGGLTTPQAILFREANPWADLGSGLAGTHGVPVLCGTGSLAAGEPVSITLGNALENTSATLFIGLSQINASFKGGVLVPKPDVILPGLPTGPTGELVLGSPWPAGIPAGFTFYFQYWVVDTAGPVGLAASNAVSGKTP